MKIITALGNPKTNEILKKENELEVICNDIQYKEGIIEELEKNNKIDLILLSEVLSGQMDFKELIEKIKTINNKIEIIVILKNEKEETIKNYLFSKGIFNIFYNNKITNKELINIIKNINKIKKEEDIKEEIKSIKKIILENNKINNKKNKIIKKIKNNKIINKIKNNKIINKIINNKYK